MAKTKFYVVWNGRTTGIFTTWDECKKQIHHFPNPQFKSFSTKQEAEEALKHPEKYSSAASSSEHDNDSSQPIEDSIVVDGACSGLSGNAEYQGVYLKTGETIFKSEVLAEGTNNMVEFLALVHALAYCKNHQLTLPIYSDSVTAIAWVRNKKAKTENPRTARNKRIFELLDRALVWLHENTYANPILKWKTETWGENPADFGRK